LQCGGSNENWYRQRGTAGRINRKNAKRVLTNLWWFDTVLISKTPKGDSIWERTKTKKEQFSGGEAYPTTDRMPSFGSTLPRVVSISDLPKLGR